MNADNIASDEEKLQQTMASKLSDFDVDYMSEMIHTGLRKGMDSEWALLMWMTIADDTPLSVWDAFLVSFKTELLTKGITAEIIYSFCEDYCIVLEGSIISSLSRHEGRIFERGINRISKDDAESLVAWIIFCIE